MAKLGSKTGLTPRPDGRIRKTVTFANPAGLKVTRTFYARSDNELFAKIAEFKDEMQRGRSFKAVAEEWQAEHWPDIGGGTKASYAKPLRDMVDYFGAQPINELAPLEVQQYIQRKSKVLSKQSVKVIRSVLSQIFDSAIRHQDIKFNFMSAVKMPRGLVDGKRDLPTDAQLQAVIDGVAKPFGLFAYMVLFGGFRRGELLALTVDDIDFERKRISITKGVIFDNGRPLLKNSPKTRAGVREVFLLDNVERLLLPYRRKGGLLFTGGSGGLVTEQGYETLWRRYCVAAGLSHKEQRTIRNGKLCMTDVPDITAHQLRHGYATLLYESGIDVKEAQLLMGHASIKTTQNVYTHIRSARHNRAFLQLNNFKFDFKGEKVV